MKTETRFVKAVVRQQNAIGGWHDDIFEVRVPMTGSYHVMAEAAIKAINAQGYEVNYIVDHASRRELI